MHSVLALLTLVPALAFACNIEHSAFGEYDRGTGDLSLRFTKGPFTSLSMAYQRSDHSPESVPDSCPNATPSVPASGGQAVCSPGPAGSLGNSSAWVDLIIEGIDSAGLRCRARVPAAMQGAECPYVNNVGPSPGMCRPCEGSKAKCYGGGLVVLHPGFCLAPPRRFPYDVASHPFDLNKLLQACVPPEACAGSSPSTAPIVPACAEGYAMASDRDSCCSSCARGFCRVDSSCVPCPGGPMRWWSVLELLITLGGLGAVFFVGRRESVFLLPNVVHLFRTSQALGIIALDVTDQCHFGLGFRFESRFFPAFMGLSDFYSQSGPSSGIDRLFTQLAFLGLYLLPLLATPAWLFFQARRGRTAGRSEPPAAAPARAGPLEHPSSSFIGAAGEDPMVALRRAGVCWFWIALLPLCYAATAQLMCSTDEGRNRLLNYPATACPSPGYLITIATSLMMLGLIIFGVVKLWRGVARASADPSAVDADHILFAFIYGHAKEDSIGVWKLDLFIVAVLVVFRSFLKGFSSLPMGLLFGTLAPAFILLVATAHVARMRPYRGWPTNASAACSLSATAIAFFVRFLRTCSFDNSSKAESGTLHLLSLLLVLLWLAAVALSALAAIKSREHIGTFRVFRSFGQLDHLTPDEPPEPEQDAKL